MNKNTKSQKKYILIERHDYNLWSYLSSGKWHKSGKIIIDDAKKASGQKNIVWMGFNNMHCILTKKKSCKAYKMTNVIIDKEKKNYEKIIYDYDIRLPTIKDRNQLDDVTYLNDYR